MKKLAGLCAALAAFGLVACGGGAKEDGTGTGSVELSITGPGAQVASIAGALRQAATSGTPDAAAQIKSVWISFESGDLGYYGDYQRVQLVDGGSFPITNVKRTGLFAGTYTVSAYAYDGADGGNVLFSASATVQVTDRNVSALNLIMQQNPAFAPPGTVNIVAPKITGIAITGTYPPVIGKPVGLQATVVNGESTGTLAYAWSVQCATDPAPLNPFSPANALATQLTLNKCEGDAVVTFAVTAKDVQGAAGDITSAVSLVLKYVPQGVDVGITINPWPNINALRATTDAQPLPGQTVDFVANASDPDGGPVAYTWSAKCGDADQNTFSPATGDAVTWTAPGTAGPCTIKVSVTDGEGGSNSATFTLYVGSVWTAMPALYPNSEATGSTITWNADGSVTLKKETPETAPNLSIVGQPQLLSTLSFDVGGAGYCGAGAPRFNVRFQGSTNLYWFACAYGTLNGATRSFVPADAWLGSSRGVLPEDLAKPISSIGIVMDEVGEVTLSNIRINGSLVTH